MKASILALISTLSRYFGELSGDSLAAAPLPFVFFSVLLRLIFILVWSGVWLTESIDDLAAEEINELEGVLVLNRQAHEELGARRSAEPLLDVFACFQVPRDGGWWHGDDDGLVVGGYLVHKSRQGRRRWITTCPLVVKVEAR